MTNGEKIKEIFPNIIKYGNILIDDIGALQKNILFDDTWWNAEYIEPTTKNNLGVDCISRQAVDRLVWQYLRKETDDNIAFYEHFLELPSVTPIRPKGHWICDGKGRNFADYHCSECGLKLALCGQDIKQRQDSGYSLFCGGCGADMREVEE